MYSKLGDLFFILSKNLQKFHIHQGTFCHVKVRPKPFFHWNVFFCIWPAMQVLTTVSERYWKTLYLRPIGVSRTNRDKLVFFWKSFFFPKCDGLGWSFDFNSPKTGCWSFVPLVFPRKKRLSIFNTVTFHISLFTHSKILRAMNLKFWHNVHLTLCVMCSVSHVRCHMLLVTYHFSHFFFNISIRLVGWGSVTNEAICLDFVSLLKTHWYLSILISACSDPFLVIKMQINGNLNRLEVPKITIPKAAPC